MNFREWISAQLSELGLNPTAFARIAEKFGVEGINQSTVQRIIKGKMPNPSEANMRRIAIAVKEIRSRTGKPPITVNEIETRTVRELVATPNVENEFSEARGKKNRTERDNLLDQINEVINQTNERGLKALLGHAMVCAEQFPLVKQTPKSSR